MKKVLVLGGTGAMGLYLVPYLRRMGYAVDVVSLDKCTSDDPDLRYITGNAKDLTYLESLLKNGYDGIVDFLIYRTPEFRERYQMFLEKTDHYIYLSSYRIYADSPVITETSPRLLDTATDPVYLASEDYSLYKARGEDILHASPYGNYSIIRPAITFSKFRFQLVTLEAPVVVRRMKEGKAVLLPIQAKDIQATMSWAGDVAMMIARLLFAPHAMKETYTLATAQHQSWGEVADYYREIGGLKACWIDKEDYISLIAGDGDEFRHLVTRWQLELDRLFTRVVDNRKILEATGMKQADLMPVKEGLRREYEALPADYIWPHSHINDAMDAWLMVK
ncbi:MAG: epimerase [Ruminococcaceae bacterium]|nr:epimerase [Oscillospiraceae bacterium]